MRLPAQETLGLSAGFDRILQTQLDSVEKPRESDPLTDQRAHDSSVSKDRDSADADQEGKSKAESLSELAKNNESAGNEAQTSTDPTSEALKSGANAEQDQSAMIRADDEDERFFIAMHGKRAAKLRWDSTGVELTHAAEVDLAEQNAQLLASRGSQAGRGVSQSGETGVSQGSEKGTARFTRSAANTGQIVPESKSSVSEEGRASSSAVPQQRSQGFPKAGVSGPELIREAQAVVVHENPNRRSQGQAATGRTGPSDLIARLGNIGSQAQATTATRGVANAVTGVSRMSLRAERSGKPAMAKPSKGNDRAATMRQVQQGLAKLLKSSGGQSTIRLTPKSLGEVTLRLEVRQGVASARFTATNEVARSLLSSGLKELRAALEMRGLRVERLAVDPAISKVSAEPMHTGAREDSQALRASDGSPLADRPEAESEGRSGFSQTPDRHSEHGHRGDQQSVVSTRSGEALHQEPLPFDEPVGIDEGWIRLDTVA